MRLKQTKQTKQKQAKQKSGVRQIRSASIREDAHPEVDTVPIYRAVLREPGTARNSERAGITIDLIKSGHGPTGRAIYGVRVGACVRPVEGRMVRFGRSA